jgi:Ca2+-transporting ATPase
MSKTPELTQSILDSLNVEQEREKNRETLDAIGGVKGLLTMIGADTDRGLSDIQVTELREKFGENRFPESPMDSFLTLLLGALNDVTLIILSIAAAVSLVIGVVTEPGGTGYIEGVAIFVAVILVSNISAGNDYSKQLQFQALEATSAADERTSVLRNGSVERINPMEIVVGDIVVLQAGDQIPADCVVCDKNIVLSNESSLTGEVCTV